MKNDSLETGDSERERALVDAAWRQIDALPAQVRTDGNTPLAGGAASPPLPSIEARHSSSTLSFDSFTGYDLIREIHRGGQGVVYQAVQHSTNRKVAIKVLREGPFAGPADKSRFEREIQILGQLQHPNIVTIHDSGSSAGHFFFVMDYIRGQPLDVFVASGERSIESLLRLLGKICDAVHSAHLRGVIHRDLKPGNIRVDEHGEPHILDFGLAKYSAGDGTGVTRQATMTVTGQFVGSLPWASPEQVEGPAHAIDIRTDVYSLGVILFHMLTGRFPYDVAGNMRNVVDNILTVEPPKPSLIRRHINDEVDTIVLKCLSKDPERRYQSAGEVARDIQRYLMGEPIEAKCDSTWYLLRKTMHRHRNWVAAGCLFLMMSLVFAVTTTFQAAEVRRGRDRATIEAAKSQRIREFLESLFASAIPERTPHEEFSLRHMLDDGAARVETEFADLPELEADVRQTLGITYDQLGLFPDASYHLERAIELRRIVFGDEHAKVAEALHHLAEAMHNGQALESAAETAREALAMRRRVLGGSAPEVADSIDALAAVLVQLNRFDEAEPLAREALAMRRSLFGDDSIWVAGSMLTLGTYLRDTGQYEQAEVMLRDALLRIRRLRGVDETGGALTQLALLLRLREKRVEEEVVLREVIALRRRILGGEHPALAWNLFSLCGLLLETDGDLDEAGALCTEALRIQRVRLDPRHPDLVQYLEQLAEIFIRNGARREADLLLEEAVAIESR